MRFMTFMVFMFVFMLFFIFDADAEIQWRQGFWRLEISGGPGLDNGKNNRSDDLLLKGTLEYEIPATPHFSLGLRAIPSFLYEQDGQKEDTVWGIGAGLGGRLYTKAGEYRGLFAEANAHVLGHKNRFGGNGSNVNFLTGLGIGYKCAGGWHTVVKWEHISNANLSDDNSGVNAITLGFGYTF